MSNRLVSKRPVSRTKRLLQGVGILIAFAFAGIAALIWDGLHDDVRHADVAVVLGNKVELDGKPSARLKARLDRTVELYREGLFPAIIVSGGIGVEGFDEAVVMKQYLVTQGIPASIIIEDNQGLTTFATAENTARILQRRKWESVLVVSQYFHISRSVLAMKHCGIQEAYSVHAKYFELRDFYSIPREALGYLRYTLK